MFLISVCSLSADLSHLFVKEDRILCWKMINLLAQCSAKYLWFVWHVSDLISMKYASQNLDHLMHNYFQRSTTLDCIFSRQTAVFLVFSILSYLSVKVIKLNCITLCEKFSSNLSLAYACHFFQRKFFQCFSLPWTSS